MDEIISYKMCAVKVRNAKLRNYLNAIGVESARFGNEAHFMSFAASVATRNGTEGSNFHI
jgi:hypothetical protein